MTTAEKALDALEAALAGVAGFATRNAVAPADLAATAAATALALVDGVESVVGEEVGGGWVRHIRRDCAVQIVARAEGAETLSEAWGALLAALGAALSADRTLGGAVDDLIFGAPFETEETRALGAPDLRAGVVPVELYYAVDGFNPLGDTP